METASSAAVPTTTLTSTGAPPNDAPTIRYSTIKKTTSVPKTDAPTSMLLTTNEPKYTSNSANDELTTAVTRKVVPTSKLPSTRLSPTTSSPQTTETETETETDMFLLSPKPQGIVEIKKPVLIRNIWIKFPLIVDCTFDQLLNR